MLRIATHYESGLGRNDGNPLYVTAFLKRMQHYCDVVRERSHNPKIQSYFPIVRGVKQEDPLAKEAAVEFMEKIDSEGLVVEHLRPYGDMKQYGEFDLHVWVDWGEDALTGILPYKVLDCPKPMFYWASDTHIQTPTADSYPYRLSMAKKADAAFVAQKRGLEAMRLDGVKDPVWLPHAVEPLAYPKQNFASKKYDVAFVGHINSINRVDALDRLFAAFPKFYFGQKLFGEAAEIFGQSKIVFNISMTDDINMRTFEGMATGSLMLTNWIPTIGDLFEDGKHLVLYRSLDEMVDKARYYIEHDDEREKIAAAGYQDVLSKHTFKNRVMRMLQEVKVKSVA